MPNPSPAPTIIIAPGTVIGFVHWPEKLEKKEKISKMLKFKSDQIVKIKNLPVQKFPVGMLKIGKLTIKNGMVSQGFSIKDLPAVFPLEITAFTSDKKHVSQTETVVLDKKKGQSIKLELE